jgi:hypothetical protein
MEYSDLKQISGRLFYVEHGRYLPVQIIENRYVIKDTMNPKNYIELKFVTGGRS